VSQPLLTQTNTTQDSSFRGLGPQDKVNSPSLSSSPALRTIQRAKWSEMDAVHENLKNRESKLT